VGEKLRLVKIINHLKWTDKTNYQWVKRCTSLIEANKFEQQAQNMFGTKIQHNQKQQVNSIQKYEGKFKEKAEN